MPFRLQPVRDRTLNRIVKRTELRSLPKGGQVYAPGDAATQVFLVREGFIRLVLPALEQGREERTVAVALPWEVFGVEGLTDRHRRYGAVAGTRCSIQALPGAAFLGGLKTARSSLDAYLEGVERDLHRLRHAQGGSRGPTASERLAETLLDLAERCGERDGRRVVLSERLTHQIVADLAGAHRATVTTLLNDWLYEGILAADTDRHLILARPAELWALAGYDRHAREGLVDPNPRNT